LNHLQYTSASSLTTCPRHYKQTCSSKQFYSFKMLANYLFS